MKEGIKSPPASLRALFENTVVFYRLASQAGAISASHSGGPSRGPSGPWDLFLALRSFNLFGLWGWDHQAALVQSGSHIGVI